jgi:hypothetical protein
MAAVSIVYIGKGFLAKLLAISTSTTVLLALVAKASTLLSR